MFVVTFYSYKGGVGRTMALVNVASQLASRGKKVLVVDFDLEAPGIAAYRQFSASAGCSGIVDYVTDYLASSEAPDASDYMLKCELDAVGENSIWVMPAGRRDEKYSEKLGNIDWQDLYSSKSGYLLFEDLKQQWRDSGIGFDYVLIDSRTGHTDVGGICTRQLADVDVMMFLPNAQNIHGMKAVVDVIKKESAERKKSLVLLFCPSNVPDLDDEEGILRDKLEYARRELGYGDPAAVIHHYNSLSLIDEAVFSIDRPRTRLSEEYRMLHDKVVEHNYEDRVGALSLIQNIRESMVSNPRLRRSVDFAAEMQDRLALISQKHSHDGEIAWNISFIYQSLGQYSEELDALSIAIEAGYSSVDAKLRRARNLLSQSLSELARVDLTDIFDMPANGMQLSSALGLLRTIDRSWSDIIYNSSAVKVLNAADAVIFADALMAEIGGADLAIQILDRSSVAADGGATKVRNSVILALISSGKFEDAILRFGASKEELVASGDIVDIFNYAMALWGRDKTPPFDLARIVLEIDGINDRPPGANYRQCMAICHLVLGDDVSALYEVTAARSVLGSGKVFSSWSYLYCDRRSMLKDLDNMISASHIGDLRPEFLRRVDVQ